MRSASAGFVGQVGRPALVTVWALLHVVAAAGSRADESRPTGTWYRGDLHAHSLYSDGDSPVATVIAGAEDAGLDFFALTDHDSQMGGTPAHWYDPDYQSQRMVLLYGIEWTSGMGHASVWAARPFDYEALWQANRNLDAVAAVAAAHAQQALFSINHPRRLLSAHWEYSVDLEIDALEAWNGPYRLPSANGITDAELWSDLLQRGRRVTAVGGSDTHELAGLYSLFAGFGNPTTWVYANNFTAEAILDGIARGHVSISQAPDALRVEFDADSNGDGGYETMMGDNIQTVETPVDFRLRFSEPDESHSLRGLWSFLGTASTAAAVELDDRTVDKFQAGRISADELLNPPSVPRGALHGGSRHANLIVVLKNGRLFRVWRSPGPPGTIHFRDTPGDRSCYRAKLLGQPDVVPLVGDLLYGNVLAVTNPIYVGFPD